MVPSLESNKPARLAQREDLIGRGVVELDGASYRFTQDYVFSSPSVAATFVLGMSSNGRTNGPQLPIVVLMNGGSASAAEIVAAALQDAGRALVVGARSYGKGTVQQIVPMPNDGELILTWARMHAPSGYGLSRFGVFPSICTADGQIDVESVVAGLRNGRLQAGEAVHRRRGADSLDQAGQEALRRT